ncbi:MAG TPA: cupin domain-containing protein [Bacteroidales bacterium]|nr:cupin domain-containing protein [Bacteroidales bacterium]
MITNEFEKAKAIDLRNSVEYSNGGIVSKTVIKRETGNISVFSFDKGEGLTEHTSPFDAVIMVLDGKGEITIGGVPAIVDSGQLIIMPRDIPHAVYAQERFKMMLIMIRSK